MAKTRTNRPTSTEETAAVQPEVAAPAPAASDLEEKLAKLAAENEELRKVMLSILASQQHKPDAEASHILTNVGGTSIAITVTEPRTRTPKNIVLDRRGASVKLSEEEVREVLAKYPRFFERGQLSCPEIVPDNANVVADIPAFLNGLTADTAEAAIGAITSPQTLTDLFYHIQTLRFEHLDAAGNPLFEVEGDQRVPAIKERSISPTLALVEQLIRRQMVKVSGIVFEA